MAGDDDEPEDPSWLKDLDWIEVNRLRRAYKEGGADALVKAWQDLLEKDPLQWERVARAYSPDEMARLVEDALEARGYTFRELIELAKKKQH